MKTHYLNEAVMYLAELPVEEWEHYDFVWYFDGIYGGNGGKVYHTWKEIGIHKITLRTIDKRTNIYSDDSTTVNIILPTLVHEEVVVTVQPLSFSININYIEGGESSGREITFILDTAAYQNSVGMGYKFNEYMTTAAERSDQYNFDYEDWMPANLGTGLLLRVQAYKDAQKTILIQEFYVTSSNYELNSYIGFTPIFISDFDADPNSNIYFTLSFPLNGFETIYNYALYRFSGSYLYHNVGVFVQILEGDTGYAELGYLQNITNANTLIAPAKPSVNIESFYIIGDEQNDGNLVLLPDTTYTAVMTLSTVNTNETNFKFNAALPRTFITSIVKISTYVYNFNFQIIKGIGTYTSPAGINVGVNLYDNQNNFIISSNGSYSLYERYCIDTFDGITVNIIGDSSITPDETKTYSLNFNFKWIDIKWYVFGGGTVIVNPIDNTVCDVTCDSSPSNDLLLVCVVKTDLGLNKIITLNIDTGMANHSLYSYIPLITNRSFTYGSPGHNFTTDIYYNHIAYFRPGCVKMWYYFTASGNQNTSLLQVTDIDDNPITVTNIVDTNNPWMDVYEFDITVEGLYKIAINPNGARGWLSLNLYSSAGLTTMYNNEGFYAGTDYFKLNAGESTVVKIFFKMPIKDYIYPPTVSIYNTNVSANAFNVICPTLDIDDVVNINSTLNPVIANTVEAGFHDLTITNSGAGPIYFRVYITEE